jgi:hypothetical protein
MFSSNAVYPTLKNMANYQYTAQQPPVSVGFQGASASSGSLRAIAVPSYGSDGSQMLTRGMAPQQSGVLGYFFLNAANPGMGNCQMASRSCGN